MSERFSFRYRVRLYWGSRLPFDEPEWSFPESRHDVRIVAGRDDEPIRESERIVLRGDNYESEGAARAAGEVARQVLQRAFAVLRFGADFGDHYRGTLHLSEAYTNRLEARYGAPVLPDHQGLMTFPSRLQPRFVGLSAKGRAGPTKPEAERALTHPGAQVPLTEPERLAHQFFGASFFVDEVPEARLLLLMAAVEALLEFRPRSEEARELVSRWREEVSAAAIEAEERDSILGQLRFVAQESITRSGQRLVSAALAGRQYDDQEPGAFFRRMYGMRSRIVHPRGRSPERTELVDAIRHLQAMVGDLLAGQTMPQ